MDPFDEEALRIMPVYKRYEKLFEPKFPWIARASVFLGLSIFGLSYFHQATGYRLLFLERLVLPWLLTLAVVGFSIWIFFGVLPKKAKSLETEFHERCTVEKEYGLELKGFSLKSRKLFSNHIHHFWDTEVSRYKFESAILLALGGILSTLPEWTGKPKVTFAFWVIVLSMAYARLLLNQKLLSKTKRFGDLLERESE